MVYRTLAYLIGKCDHIAAAIKECAAHEVIAAPAQDCQHVSILLGIHEGRAEFVEAPTKRRDSVALWQTEFDMITGIMKTATQINRSLTSRIEPLFIGCDKRCRHICANVVT